MTEVVLAPGNRVELLVDTTAGSSTLVTVPVDRGSAMMGGSASSASGPVELLSLTVAGTPVSAPAPVPDGAPLPDLRAEPVAARRTLEFAMGMGGMGGMGGGMGQEGGMSFTVNGQSFDPSRTDTPVAAGTVEEWTLVNPSPMNHPIHLHVWPMQVLADGSTDGPRWQDVVDVPARGSVTVRVPFRDFSGRTVYHCHILDHEDQGMMATVEAR